MTPSSSARRIVRSTRIGDIGWLGPKLYSVSVGSKTTVAGPVHSTMLRGYLPVTAVAGLAVPACETRCACRRHDASIQWWPA